MNGSNPMLSEKIFGRSGGVDAVSRMTARGAYSKTVALLLVAVAAAALPVSKYFDSGTTDSLIPYLLIGMIGGLLVALPTFFVPRIAPWTAPLYAALEGLFLGAASTVLELQYPGIAIQAVGLTFSVLLVMLFLYRTGIIKVTQRLRTGVIAAIFGVLVFYLVSMVVSLFGVNTDVLFNGDPIGIGVSLVIVGIAAFHLLLDFDFIESASAGGAPKYMEWLGALGLMITLVWLYMHLLRLLSQLRR